MKYLRHFIFLFPFVTPIYADLPCSDPSILDLTDRGSLTDTPCVVPNKKILAEGGFQYQRFDPSGTLSNYPQLELVYGLPNKYEVLVILPSYYSQASPSVYGIGATTIGAKHELIVEKDWILSIQGLISPPGGNENYGSKNTGGAFNSIIGFDLLEDLSGAVMVGASSYTESAIAGGRRFFSFNPSIAFLYTGVDKLAAYVEIFSQTRVASDAGSIFIVDAGFLYTVNKKMILDIEAGQRLNGPLYTTYNYIGLGLTVIV